MTAMGPTVCPGASFTGVRKGAWAYRVAKAANLPQPRWGGHRAEDQDLERVDVQLHRRHGEPSHVRVSGPLMEGALGDQADEAERPARNVLGDSGCERSGRPGMC